MDMISFLGDCNNNTLGGAYNGVISIIYYAKLVLRILQIAVPIGLIIMGTVDMAKAVIAGDEKKIKEAQKPFIKRIIAAVIVFLIPWIVSIVIGIAGNATSNTYLQCWNDDATNDKPNVDNDSNNIANP